MHPDPMGPAQERLNDYVARISEIQHQAQQTQEQIRSVRGRASSPDGTVNVVLAAGGRLESLTLTPQAMQHGHQRLATMISETVRAAHDEAAGRTQAALQPLVGDSAAMEFLREQVAQAQADDPAAAADLHPTGEPDQRSTRRMPTDDSDEDGLDGPYLQR